MAWQFANRIFAPEKPFTSTDTNEAVRTLYESEDETVTLRAHQSAEGFTNADRFTLKGKGYASSDEAYAAGKLWRHYLSVAFANAGFVVVLDSEPLYAREGERERSPDAPGLRVSPQPKGSTFGWMSSQAYGKVTRPIDLFMSDVSDARQSIPQGLNSRIELAYATFHTAAANQSAEVKYIMFVTAVEALIDDDVKKSVEVVTGLNRLRQYVNDADDFAGVRNELQAILKEDEKESISQLGMKVASQLSESYGGKPPDEFFKRVYGVRSALVHGAHKYTGGRKRPTLQQIAEALPELRRFVFDLLKAESAK